MRWGFIVDITSGEITLKVREQASEAGSSMKGNPKYLYRVEITFYQSEDRYLKDDLQKPREDRGDIDNLVKCVFDGLGPIIGFRRKWRKNGGKLKGLDSNKPADSRIVELMAKKVNSGSKNEYVSVEIETI